MKAPLLVITDKLSPTRFSSYILEILDIEGVFARDVLDLSETELSHNTLSEYDTVVLSNIPLPDSIEKHLRDYARAGGNLIALRPPKKMGDLFGLKPYEGVNKTVDECYIMLEKDHHLGSDLSVELLQFHGSADLYLCGQGQALAFISGDSQSKSPFPAVVTYEQDGKKRASFIYIAMRIPLIVFIYVGFLKTIPRELDAAAIIDGCGNFRLFFQIISPLLKPITVTSIVLVAQFVWNVFDVILYFIQSSKKFTLPLSVYAFAGRYSTQWNLIFAGAIISVLPVLIVYLLGQKYIVAGLTSGALKA